MHSFWLITLINIVSSGYLVYRRILVLPVRLNFQYNCSPDVRTKEQSKN